MPFKNPPPLYSLWQTMKRRCLNPSAKQFADYGGRGIKVCDEWMTYSNFERDMSPRPPGRQLERIDTNGNYELKNCCWATHQEQMRNQRRTIFVTIEGNRYKAIELAELNGVKVDTIVKRAKIGLSFDEVVAKTRYPTQNGWRRAVAARVAKQRARTHCKRGHEFLPENTYLTKEGARVCRQCHNAKVRRQQMRKRARV
jgi:hypothetical protein